jgi:hypothetical protein
VLGIQRGVSSSGESRGSTEVVPMRTSGGDLPAGSVGHVRAAADRGLQLPSRGNPTGASANKAKARGYGAIPSGPAWPTHSRNRRSQARAARPDQADPARIASAGAALPENEPSLERVLTRDCASRNKASGPTTVEQRPGSCHPGLARRFVSHRLGFRVGALAIAGPKGGRPKQLGVCANAALCGMRIDPPWL